MAAEPKITPAASKAEPKVEKPKAAVVKKEEAGPDAKVPAKYRKFQK